MYKGLDLFALATMDPKMLSTHMRKGCSFGFLMETFGNALPNAEYLLIHNSPPACRVHLSNGPCARNNNCGDGEIGPRDFGKLAQRAAKIEVLAREFRHTKFFISPRVEHDEKKDIVRRWLSILQINAPSCTPVLSCGPRGSILPSYLIEEHGNDALSAIVSNDGNSIFDFTGNWANRGTVMSLAWDYCFNLRRKDETQFIPPLKRDHKLGPTSDILDQIQNRLFL